MKKKKLIFIAGLLISFVLFSNNNLFGQKKYKHGFIEYELFGKVMYFKSIIYYSNNHTKLFKDENMKPNIETMQIKDELFIRNDSKIDSIQRSDYRYSHHDYGYKFKYDQDGYLIEVNCRNSKAESINTLYFYNNKNQLKEVKRVKNNKITDRTRRIYKLDGSFIEEVMGGYSMKKIMYENQYNKSGSLVVENSASYNGNKHSNYFYDSSQKLTREEHFSSNNRLAKFTNYLYENNLLKEKSWKQFNNERSFGKITFEYEFNNEENIQKKTGKGKSYNVIEEFKYDKHGNWIECKIKDRLKNYTLITREIRYYN